MKIRYYLIKLIQNKKLKNIKLMHLKKKQKNVGWVGGSWIRVGGVLGLGWVWLEES